MFNSKTFYIEYGKEFNVITTLNSLIYINVYQFINGYRHVDLTIWSTYWRL